MSVHQRQSPASSTQVLGGQFRHLLAALVVLLLCPLAVLPAVDLPAEVAFDAPGGVLSLSYTGSPQVMSTTTSPAGLAVSVTYDTGTGPGGAPSAIGFYTVIATVTEPGYEPATVSGSLTILPAVRFARTVHAWGHFPTPPSPPYDDDGISAVPAGEIVQVDAEDANFIGLTADGGVVAWGIRAPAVPSGLPAMKAVVAGSSYKESAGDPGEGYALGVATDGTVHGWGVDYSLRASPPSTITDAVAVAAGDYGAVALRAGGTLEAWGLGVAATGMPSGLTGVVAISGSQTHMMALLDDGTVRTWGNSGASDETPPGDLGFVVAISAGYDFSVALESDGTVRAWGATSLNQAVVPSGLHGTAIAAGHRHTAVLQSDGSVFVFGLGGYTGNSSYPIVTDVPVVTGIDGLALGSYNALAVADAPTAFTYDGTPKALAAPLTKPYGQPVTVTYDDGVSAPSAVPPTAAGTYNVLALIDGTGVTASTTMVISPIAVTLSMSDDTVTYDGSDHALVPGVSPSGAPVVVTYVLNSVSSTTAPTAAGTYTVTAAITDPNYTATPATATLTIEQAQAVLIIDDDDVTVAYDGTAQALPVTTVPAGVAVTQLFNGGPTAILPGNYTVGAYIDDPNYRTADGEPSSQAGVLHITAPPTLSITFDQDYYLVDDDASPHALVPTVVPAALPVTVTYDGSTTPPSAPGSYLVVASCSEPAFTVLPAVAVLHVGLDDATVHFAKLAAGWSGDDDMGQTVPGAAEDLVAISASRSSFLGLTAAGRVHAWGASDDWGQLSPPATLNHVSAIAMGERFGLAVRVDGRVVAWGDDTYGQLDVPDDLDDAVAVAASDYVALALRSDGSLVTWGAPVDPLTTDAPTGLTDVVAIAGGHEHFLALRSDGTVVAWGHDYAGETSVPGDLADVMAVAAGLDFSLALKTDGTVVAWGDDDAGKATVPADLANVVAIAAGDDNALALTVGGDVVGWGLAHTENLPDCAGRTTAIAAGLGCGVVLYTPATGFTYDGASHPYGAAAHTLPPGLTTAVTYAGASTVPLAAGSYPVAATIDEVGWSGTPATAADIEIGTVALDIYADQLFIHVGDPAPVLTYTTAGWIAGEDETLLSGALESTAVDTATEGSFDILIGALTAPGNYVVTFHSDYLHILPLNTPPYVYVNEAQVIPLDEPRELNGGYYDIDELAFGQTVTETWRKVSGPGTVTFDPCDPYTPIFDRDGTYVLRLEVDDGVAKVGAKMTVVVTLPGTTIVDNATCGCYDDFVTFGSGWRTSAVRGFAGTQTVYSKSPGDEVYWAADLDDGWYDVSYWCVDGSTTAQDALVVHADGLTPVAYGGPTTTPGWVSVGTFRSDGYLVLDVLRINGILRADAVRFIRLPGEIVNNEDADYHELSGGFTTSGAVKGLNGSTTRYARGSGETAVWAAPDLRGEARVLLYRLPNPTNERSWGGVVFADGGETPQYEIEGRGGVAGWADLGRHAFGPGGAAVVLGNPFGAKLLRTDAVRFALDTVVDDGDPGYREEGDGWGNSYFSPNINHSVRYSRSAAAAATWRASLAPGRYRVSRFRKVSPESTTDVRVSVTHDGVTDQVAVDDLTAGSTGWQVLGDFQFSDGTGEVRIKHGTNDRKTMRADAVRFEPLGDSAPVTAIPDGGPG